MDVEKLFHMTGGAGPTSYAKNSYLQKNVSDMATFDRKKRCLSLRFHFRLPWFILRKIVNYRKILCTSSTHPTACTGYQRYHQVFIMRRASL
ncbi:hypothetical protein LWI29_029261 [Acer saccharum]|uniref:Uncharacterized protein n=1 Tax=Acer saccharum TaxID=4024 RepID=A0AA39TIC4_ACESA|nr:hypothetical protein LWI29_029261 [Acer saccharum]